MEDLDYIIRCILAK